MLKDPSARWSPPVDGAAIDAAEASRLLTVATLKVAAALRKVDGRLGELSQTIELVRAGGFAVDRIPAVITAATPLTEDLPRLEKHLAVLAMWMDWPTPPGIGPGK